MLSETLPCETIQYDYGQEGVLKNIGPWHDAIAAAMGSTAADGPL